MKNITVTVDDELYYLARVRAAERKSTVSALVRNYLKQLVAADANEQPALGELISHMRTTYPGFSASDRLPRDQAHDRHALR